MPLSYLTRKDADVGEGLYDSIQWAIDVHVADSQCYINANPQPDLSNLKSALLYGREDSPHQINFYVSANPTIKSKIAFAWIADPMDDGRE